MTLQQTAQRQIKSVHCRCGAPMRLLRIDPYPMPRATVEIQVLECPACHATLQQIQTSSNNSPPCGAQ